MSIRQGRRLLLALALVVTGTAFLVDLAREFSSPHAGVLDFGVYYRAAVALSHHQALYVAPPPCCFNSAAMNGYTYPPLFAFAFIPLTALPVDDAGRLWLTLNCVSLAALLVVGIRSAPGLISSEAKGWLVLLVLSSGSVAGALHEMQATPLVIALEAVFAWCVIQDRAPGRGGIVLGLGTVIKVWPLLLAPAALRLQRASAQRFLAALALTLAVAGVVMFVISPQFSYYLTRVAPSFSSGVLSPTNLSLPGVVLRTLAAAGVHPASLLRFVFTALELTGLAVTFALCRGVPGKAGRALTVAGFLAVIPIVQGVTWNHHLIASILALVLILPLLRSGSIAWLLAVGGTVLAMVWPAPVESALVSLGWSPPHNPLQFAIFIVAAAFNSAGMCALWLSVVLTARRLRSAAARGESEFQGRQVGPLSQAIHSA